MTKFVAWNSACTLVSVSAALRATSRPKSKANCLFAFPFVNMFFSPCRIAAIEETCLKTVKVLLAARWQLTVLVA